MPRVEAEEIISLSPQPNRDDQTIKCYWNWLGGQPEQGFGKFVSRGYGGWAIRGTPRVSIECFELCELEKRRKGKRWLPTRNPVPLEVSRESLLTTSTNSGSSL